MIRHRTNGSDASARVSPEVNDQSLHALFLELIEVLSELAHRHVIEFRDLQITDPVVEQLGIHRRRIDPGSLETDLYLFSAADQGQRDLCSLFSPDVAYDFIKIEPCHILAVDLIDEITFHQACRLGR